MLTTFGKVSFFKNVVKSIVGIGLVSAIFFNHFLSKYPLRNCIIAFLVFSLLYISLIEFFRKKESKYPEHAEFNNETKYIIFFHWEPLDILYFFSMISIGVVWVLALSIPFGRPFLDNSANYILSSISQGLAALFALIFSLSLIIAQISTRYSSHLTIKIFNVWTGLFMALFVIGILLPLFALKTEDLFLLDISIGLCGTNVILLAPYMAYLKDQINPSQFLKELSDKAIDKLKDLESESPSLFSRNFSDIGYYFNEIYAIDSTILRAYQEADYDTFIMGIKALLRIGTSEKIMNKHAIKEIFTRLTWIGEETSHYRDTISQIGLILKNAAVQALRSNREFIADKAISILGDLVEKILCKENDRKVSEAIRDLGEINSMLIKNKMEESAENSIYWLWQIGDKAAKQNCEYSLGSVLHELSLVRFHFRDSDPERNRLISKCVRSRMSVACSALNDMTNQELIRHIVKITINDKENSLGNREARKELLRSLWILGTYLKELPDDAFRKEYLGEIKLALLLTDSRERNQAFDETLLDYTPPDLYAFPDLERRRQLLLEFRSEIDLKI